MLKAPWQCSWEEFNGGSKAHIYGMFPGCFLSTHVLGVRRDAPQGKPNRVVGAGELSFAATALAHGHIYGQCRGLIEAGAELRYVFYPDPEKVAAFRATFPRAVALRSEAELLERVGSVSRFPRVATRRRSARRADATRLLLAFAAHAACDGGEGALLRILRESSRCGYGAARSAGASRTRGSSRRRATHAHHALVSVAARPCSSGAISRSSMNS